MQSKRARNLLSRRLIIVGEATSQQSSVADLPLLLRQQHDLNRLGRLNTVRSIALIEEQCRAT
ncbi:uncharacterized protein PHALS_01775 [Plasmopara halstedii]|uniref:Uncharacterized protein n=1 Tax=Plasmopara halstedii TaxID=4781 RepID=A0A0N7L6X4_PLAHL|nr:uncharacterized protein PHALS_01775 [Plasmopara halstedii]CEG45483.1 hypothetical protein PHALS_01775 [Plasmopara halstedii]|eukprot:XP_024581852.1 hypothetical protein PHALS_01775 [Plasmopara halstedii]